MPIDESSLGAANGSQDKVEGESSALTHASDNPDQKEVLKMLASIVGKALFFVRWPCFRLDVCPTLTKSHEICHTMRKRVL